MTKNQKLGLILLKQNKEKTMSTRKQRLRMEYENRMREMREAEEKKAEEKAEEKPKKKPATKTTTRKGKK